MTPDIRPLVAGNWKMNGLKASAAEFKAMIEGYDDDLARRVDLMICPPATLVLAFAQMAQPSELAVGGQDCHAEASGAHTGDIAAEMLADAGATAVIVGHSERRQDHDERDSHVRDKAKAAWRAGLIAIVCVGETEAERDEGVTLDRIESQLKGSIPDDARAANLVVAYEPVWAIGTGRTPTPGDVAEVHTFIRDKLSARFGEDEGGRMRILYGGSVKPSNAEVLMTVDNVDGALVGGASLKADDILAIAGAYKALSG